MEYWFNTKTGQVESDLDPERARSADLLGPYGSAEEAGRALEIAQQRTAAWDAEEAAEDEWKSGDAQASAWDNNPLNG
ncbi:MAG: methionine aminopeptidase [Ornithinimicrobium sp.]|uniref:methionine aminopeptidase n=1 Tax=Ornithinimicrobium sp. TaxID=1977084 RepID=UPI0026E07B2C|nr:methionine aminopeptidase [Ornithinimicrobium sp.]MDO5739528.1 methionine aminopeptidase [Ornithinimicrobium sp.]